MNKSNKSLGFGALILMLTGLFFTTSNVAFAAEEKAAEDATKEVADDAKKTDGKKKDGKKKGEEEPECE